MIITLSKPLSVRGEDVFELNIDLEALSGKDLIDIETNMRLANQNTGAWDMSRAFLTRVAAKAAKLPPELLETLPIKDFIRINNQVLLFFADMDSADSTHLNSETSSYPSPSQTQTLD